MSGLLFELIATRRMLQLFDVAAGFGAGDGLAASLAGYRPAARRCVREPVAPILPRR
jgi:hypothetical protein